MTEFSALDELVPLHEEEPDWSDVLRRARRRRPTMRFAAAVLVAVAVFGVAPALAVVLLHSGSPGLPKEADRSNVVVIMQPLSGRVLLEVAPRKDGNGFCYLVSGIRSGCVARSHQTVILKPPLFGWTFDPRVRSGVATTPSGGRVRLFVQHFGGRVNATIFLNRGRLPHFLKSVTLYDAAGKAVSHAAAP